MKTIPIQASRPEHPAADRVRQLAAHHASQPGALLPLLHAVQDALGHVPAAVVPVIADALNLSRAEVHGVVSYYHHFRSAPASRVLLQLCQAEACQARGAAVLAEEAERMTGCAMHATRADAAVTLEPVYCLGLCASGPSVMINGRPQARVTPQRLRALLEQSLQAPITEAASAGQGVSA